VPAPSRWRRYGPLLIGLAVAVALGTWVLSQTIESSAPVISALRGAQPAAAADRQIVQLRLIDATTGVEITSSHVTFDSIPAAGLGGGRYAASLAPGAAIAQIDAEGYRPTPMPARRDAGLVVSLIPAIVTGTISDADGAPLPHARVTLDDRGVVSDVDGHFAFDAVPADPQLEVRASGFANQSIDVGDRTDVTIVLEPQDIRGAYLTYYGIADPDIRNGVVKLLANDGLNALVVDVKGDLGYLTYESRVPLADEIGSNNRPTYTNLDEFVAQMKSQGVYMIARIVVFKDDMLARNGARVGLDVAVKDRTTGGIWTDGERLGWVDPFRTEVWDYNTALAEEAIDRGFDEVQFDYVRFPTDPGVNTALDRAKFSQVPTDENRPDTITAFLTRAHEAVNAHGGTLGADIFGYVCWRDDDLGIGQNLERLATAVDYLHPMVYPSTFNGLPMDPGYADSPAYPYETVFYSLQRAKARLVGTGVALRPWLQYFDDYPWVSGKRYGPTELNAQRRAIRELGLPGWMWWDPTNLYRYGAETHE
jgi:hypothetical protein